MQPDIIISNVQISFLEFRRIQQRLTLRKRLWIYILILIYPLYSTWATDSAESSSSLGFKIGFTFFFLTIVGGSILYANRVTLRRNFEQTPLYQQPITFILSKEGITLESPIIHSTSAWHTVHSVHQIGEWYVLASKNLQGYLLDTRRIQAPATEADLRTYLQQHGIIVK